MIWRNTLALSASVRWRIPAGRRHSAAPGYNLCALLGVHLGSPFSEQDVFEGSIAQPEKVVARAGRLYFAPDLV